MTPDSFAPDLYEHFDLDRRNTSRELGILLAAKDARLEQMGLKSAMIAVRKRRLRIPFCLRQRFVRLMIRDSRISCAQRGRS